MSPLSWNVAVKFLMARKFDVLRAIELFHSYRVRMGCGSWGRTSPCVSECRAGGHAVSLPQETRLKEGIVKLKPHEEPLRSELLSGKFTILVGARSDAAQCGAACRHAVTSLSPTERPGPLGGLHRLVHGQAAPPQPQRAARGAPGALLPAGQGCGEVS